MFRDVLKVIVTFLSIVKYSVERQYEYVLEDETVFSDCHQNISGYSNINKLFDLSNTSFAMVEGGGIAVSGSIVTVWNIQATDVIQVSLSVTYYDRGIWQPTILNFKYPDFCSILHAERNLFYQFIYYALNSDTARRNCLNVAGSKVVFEPFVLSLVYGIDVLMKPGRYRATYLLTAKDHLGQLRPEKICFEMNGSFEIL